jgi:glucokinase-like ROK family protein
MKKATHQHTREHNRNLVLKTILGHETVSRAEISRITRLTRATVSKVVANLIDEGLVREVGHGLSRGGKSPILLSLVADSRNVIGLDLAHDRFTGALVDLRGRIGHKVDAPVHGRDGDAALASVFEVLDKLLKMAQACVVGIGIGTPGLVDVGRGIVVNAVNLNWRDLPLRQLVQARYGLPVAVLNDSQAAAVGEHTFSKNGNPDDSLVVVNVRHGIGAGIIIRGELFHGDGGGAGEIGHIVLVREGGLPCRCGNLGCLETVASTRAIVERAQMMARHSTGSILASASGDITFESLERAFADGDPLARQIVLEAGRFLGTSVSMLVGTLNIHRILITGDMTRFGTPFLESVREAMSQTALNRLLQDTRVEFDQMAEDEIVLGASALILGDYSLLFQKRRAQTLQAS